MLNHDRHDEIKSHTEVFCQHCGKLIAQQPFVYKDKTYCSEHCLLKTRDICYVQEDMFNLLAETLVNALDLREHETGLHSKRVACHTLVLAHHFISDPGRLQQIYWGGLLHDIGKIGVPDAILLKPGPLTASEWRELRTHPEKGYQLISHIPGMTEAANIILCHEERYDGTGYPRGLSGNQIPLGARLFMVIDTLDAITSDRSYRKGASYDVAKAEIVRMSGSQFDPEAVDVFNAEEAVLREMIMAKCQRPSLLR